MSTAWAFRFPNCKQLKQGPVALVGGPLGWNDIDGVNNWGVMRGWGSISGWGVGKCAAG